ncbi:hypothetical protein COOONC_09555, partial [Cooperia oncophora]
MMTVLRKSLQRSRLLARSRRVTLQRKNLRYRFLLSGMQRATRRMMRKSPCRSHRLEVPLQIARHLLVDYNSLLDLCQKRAPKIGKK